MALRGSIPAHRPMRAHTPTCAGSLFVERSVHGSMHPVISPWRRGSIARGRVHRPIHWDASASPHVHRPMHGAFTSRVAVHRPMHARPCPVHPALTSEAAAPERRSSARSWLASRSVWAGYRSSPSRTWSTRRRSSRSSSRTSWKRSSPSRRRRRSARRAACASDGPGRRTARRTAPSSPSCAARSPNAVGLADFGLKPDKEPEKSVAVKAEAIAKAKATRDARHTMGKRQRKKVRG